MLRYVKIWIADMLLFQFVSALIERGKRSIASLGPFGLHPADDDPTGTEYQEETKATGLAAEGHELQDNAADFHQGLLKINYACI